MYCIVTYESLCSTCHCHTSSLNDCITHKESPQVLPMQHKEDAQAIYERIESRALVVGTQEA